MTLSDWQQDLIIEDLAEGYGAEDIALRHQIPAGSVRFLIGELRAQGLLEIVYNIGGVG